MAIVSKAVDAVVVLMSLFAAVAVPLVDSQVVLPRRLYPAPLVDVYWWLVAESDHYLAADPPPFFRGLFWLLLTFAWPLAVANLYGVLTRRRWVATTCLMAGVFLLTYLSAILGEILGSGRATSKLIQLYVPFGVFAGALILRGLRSESDQVSVTAVPPPAEDYFGKKRI